MVEWARGMDPGAWAVSDQMAGGPASIIFAKVILVNPAECTLDAIGISTNATYADIPFSSLYSHPDHAGGVHIMPEEGAHCFVALCRDNTRFVVGFIHTPLTFPKLSKDDEDNEQTTMETDASPNYRNKRVFLEPGDIFLGTQDENKIILRRGGMIQIGATSLAQRFYLPIENVVRDYFQKYQAFSPLGEIEWGHANLIAEDVDDAGIEANTAETPVIVKYNIKNLVQEKVNQKIGHGKPWRKFTVEVRVGRLTGEALDTEIDAEHIFGKKRLEDVGSREQLGLTDDYAEATEDDWEKTDPVTQEVTGRSSRGAISISVWPHDGPNKEKVTYTFQLSKDGDCFLHSKGHIHIELDKTVYANIKQGVKIEYGDEGAPNGQSVIELMKTNEFKAELKRMVTQVVDDIEFNGKTFVVNASEEDGIKLGSSTEAAPTKHAVLWEDLQDYIDNKLMLLTAWGPTTPGAAKGGLALGTSGTNAKSKKVVLE